MEVGMIFKIAAVGVIVSILNQILKHSGRDEHVFLTTLAGLLLVLYWLLPYIVDLFTTMKNLFEI
ncbi:MAG: stage III sporulation protein AC [Eubacteriales bacterium]|nr:stage III sporulation protein AC [Eubacteriales bacterium]